MYALGWNGWCICEISYSGLWSATWIWNTCVSHEYLKPTAWFWSASVDEWMSRKILLATPFVVKYKNTLVLWWWNVKNNNNKICAWHNQCLLGNELAEMTTLHVTYRLELQQRRAASASQPWRRLWKGSAAGVSCTLKLPVFLGRTQSYAAARPVWNQTSSLPRTASTRFCRGLRMSALL